MKVAVTGGSGFIGSHVVDKLVAAGHHVIIIDSGRPPGRTDAAYRDADIRDLSALVRATSGCDVIFHLAGVSNVNDAMADPVTCMEVNVVGDGERSCCRVGEDRFLVKGTSVDLTAQGDSVLLVEGLLDLRSVQSW